MLREFTFLTLSLTVGLFVFYYWSTKLNSHSSFDACFFVLGLLAKRPL